MVANHFSHFSPTIHVGAAPAGALMVGKNTVIFAVCFCSFRRNAIRCGCQSLLHPDTFHLRLYSFCSASFVAERPPCTNFFAKLCWNRSCGSKSNLAGFRISCLKGKRSVRHPSFFHMFHTKTCWIELREERKRDSRKTGHIMKYII